MTGEECQNLAKRQTEGKIHAMQQVTSAFAFFRRAINVRYDFVINVADLFSDSAHLFRFSRRRCWSLIKFDLDLGSALSNEIRGRCPSTVLMLLSNEIRGLRPSTEFTLLSNEIRRCQMSIEVRIMIFFEGQRIQRQVVIE